jgi:hypothetical protein
MVSLAYLDPLSAVIGGDLRDKNEIEGGGH